MAPARFPDCGSENVICNPNAIGPPRWAPIGPTMATCATNLTNPARPARLSDVPKHSGLHFFTSVIAIDILQTIKIIEKPLQNQGFSMVFMNPANLMQNQQSAASGCPGTLRMEAFGTQNGTPGQQHEPPELQIEAPERPDNPSRRQDGCPAKPWRPNLLLSMLLTTIFDASGSLRE